MRQLMSRNQHLAPDSVSYLPSLVPLCLGGCFGIQDITQKIGEELVALFGQDGFGMELHPLHRQVPVPDTHDLAIIGPCGQFETGGQAFLFDDQRMIARGSQRVGQSVENPGILVADFGSFAVHQLSRMNNPSAESLPDALVAKADAQDRDLARKSLDQGYRDTGFAWCTRPGRNDNTVGTEPVHFF